MLKSNSSKILPVIANSSVFISFFFVLKVKFNDLKFESCQFKLE